MNESRVLTREQVREVDRQAIEGYGIPGVVLMENAGRRVAEVALGAVGRDGPVVILCGNGNNGGDGYVVARHLSNAGKQVALFATKDPADLAGDAAVHAAIVERMGLPVRVVSSPESAAEAAAAWTDATVVIDALLGTGFAGEVRSPHADLIEACNRVRGATIIAVDVPSGLDCDTGRPARSTVRADVTVTFVAPKSGFGNPAAKPYLGRVVVGDIGAPKGLAERICRG